MLSKKIVIIASTNRSFYISVLNNYFCCRFQILKLLCLKKYIFEHCVSLIMTYGYKEIEMTLGVDRIMDGRSA